MKKRLLLRRIEIKDQFGEYSTVEEVGHETVVSRKSRSSVQHWIHKQSTDYMNNNSIIDIMINNSGIKREKNFVTTFAKPLQVLLRKIIQP